MKKLLSSLLLLTCASLIAAEIKAPSLAPLVTAAKQQSESLFKAGEFTLDIAGVYSDAAAEFSDVTITRPSRSAPPAKTPTTTVEHSSGNGTWGLAVGGAYWFTKNFGLGADAVVPDLNHVEDFGNVNVSLYARYPIGRFAPYALAGGGRNFVANDFTYHVGGGVEFRFTKNFGVFGEGRYVWSFDNAPEYPQGRFGVRFAF